LVRSNVGGMPKRWLSPFFRISIDNLDGQLFQASSRSVHNHLEILPIKLRFLLHRRPTPTRVSRYLAPCSNYRFPVAALSIRRDWWWSIGVTSDLQLCHQL
jgi:hypothetical protein